MTEQIRTGGCQCGAVRFRIKGKLGRPSICHCRMCQKQFGSFFGALVTVPSDGVGLAIGAFDNPAEIVPLIQWGTEAKLPYVDTLPQLPGEDTMADVSSAPYLTELVSYQHPDHDTEQWPPEERP